MSNWVSHYAMHLKKLKVRSILPETGDNEINIGDAATVTRFHGNVEMPERSIEFPEVDTDAFKDYADEGDQAVKDYSDSKDDNIKSKYLPLSGGTDHKLTGDIYAAGWTVKGLGDPVNATDAIRKTEYNELKALIEGIDTSGGVPVGAIMFWLNSTPPAGWLKLHGATFDVDKYPKLHSYLKSTEGYTSGHLPNWAGRYPVEYGDHATADLGTMVGFRTALPTNKPINAQTYDMIPNGGTRTFNGAGGTNAYSDSASRVNVKLTGGDNVTRPPSVVGHYIIKHD